MKTIVTAPLLAALALCLCATIGCSPTPPSGTKPPVTSAKPPATAAAPK